METLGPLQIEATKPLQVVKLRQHLSPMCSCAWQVAIEALGPLKVLKNKPSITGNAAHRQNMLSALGWTVVPVKETDWLSLKTPADKTWRLGQLLPE